MHSQIWNPFLPLHEYVPDGEPHVFNDRLYLFGSHDQEDGDTYCMLDYVCWSASVSNLTQWRCEGVIYRASQNPSYCEQRRYMYAPDAVQGNDGRYYLYYSLLGDDSISVAVCDTPAGKYEYHGKVRNPDGSVFRKFVPSDPAVINDDGVIRLYYGWSLALEQQQLDAMLSRGIPLEEQLVQAQMMLSAVRPVLNGFTFCRTAAFPRWKLPHRV